jgi:hypothetical protein
MEIEINQKSYSVYQYTNVEIEVENYDGKNPICG